MANELVLRGVSKSFGGVQALKNVTLGFNAGEVHGIIGKTARENLPLSTFFPAH